MNTIFLAIKVFFKIIFDRSAAEMAVRIMNTKLDDKKAADKISIEAGETFSKENERSEKKIAGESIKKIVSLKSEAVILLSALQREARFIDFMKESLDSFTDAQIGSAARSVHRESAKTLERFFSIKELAENSEGTEIEIPQPADPDRYSLTGNVTSSARKGKIRHCGWKITKCDLPVWNGEEKNKEIISPIEIEI